MNTPFLQTLGLLFRYPAFGRFWIGQLISMLGDAMTYIALPWFVLQTTESATATAGILLTLQLPAILSGWLVGPLIDRYQPRAIIAGDNGLRCAIIALIPLLYWYGALPLWLLFALTFCAGFLLPATLVAAQTIIPDMVDDEDLDAANMLWALSGKFDHCGWSRVGWCTGCNV